jgi:hypothetical protein
MMCDSMLYIRNLCLDKRVGVENKTNIGFEPYYLRGNRGEIDGNRRKSTEMT